MVFNHTAEGNEEGPTLSLKGLDNAVYYRLLREDKRFYENLTGCGNTVNCADPAVRHLIIDCLRYWVEDMHVDGFRFDLATVLARDDGGFNGRSPLFDALRAEPSLAYVKLIAEPWDIGPGGYQLGRFPSGWVEWNDRFRDTVRAWWLGGDSTRGDFAHRLCASAEQFRAQARPPSASLNYVVSHDGFTLRDLVSYDLRHNEANGEGNRDGHGHNLSWNCGIEGPTDDPVVLALRARLQRALLATLLLAQGTPMLAAGDELGHSQQGNNNPYCQDNAITWIDWSRTDETLIDFCAALIRTRRELLPLGEHWHDDARDADGNDGLRWLRPDGEPLQGEQWHDPASRTLGLRIGRRGQAGPALLLLVNAGPRPLDWPLPEGRWRWLLDSSAPRSEAPRGPIDTPVVTLPERSLGLLQQDP